MIGRAKRMVAQNFDHAAIGNLAACTLQDHALEFGFQRGQARKAAFNLGQLRPGDDIGGCAGLIGSVRETQKVSDSVQRKTELPRMADEG